MRAVTLDWTGRGNAGGISLVKVKSRDAELTAEWLGHSRDEADAIRRATDFARRSHAILATMRKPRQTAEEACWRAFTATDDSGEPEAEVSLGIGMARAFGLREGLPRQTFAAKAQTLKDVADAGLRLHARQALLPDCDCAIQMRFATWRANDGEGTFFTALSTLDVSTTDRFRELPRPDALAALHEALAVLTALKGRGDDGPMTRGEIEVPASATLRAALRASLQRNAERDLRLVQSFLGGVGLAAEAKAWDALK